ncbi:hypothetical protein AYI68_g4131 [Smittium mucronatum]|uniref:Uncharacterized protein n=1 Tax=Smittium mucronatum TaxID=133383 RepID=A0A1R0GXZ1_9FUNG|nr:hypothetical protein AYI68_g4131 [Smittium mucronatum]
MDMVIRNHEFFGSGFYHYGFAPGVDAWLEIAEDSDSNVSASISIKALDLSEELDPSLSSNPSPPPPDKILVYYFYRWGCTTLSVFSTGSNGKIIDRRSKGEIPALNSLLDESAECASNNAIQIVSSLATLQQFRIENLYQ